MSTSTSIGKKVKQLRTDKKLTLKDMSEMTNLSTGFLSQLERGMTNIAIDSLEKISAALEVDLSYFFALHNVQTNSPILRSYEKTIFEIEPEYSIHYHLSSNANGKLFFPRMIELLPLREDEEITEYPHEGEEFVYVLEGILTLFIDHVKYELYPGDSAHYSSTTTHNWGNYTNKRVRFVAVHTPNPLQYGHKE